MVDLFLEGAEFVHDVVGDLRTHWVVIHGQVPEATALRHLVCAAPAVGHTPGE